MRREKIFFAIVMVLMMFFAVTGYSELTNEFLPDREGVKAGPAFVHTAFSSKMEYDSNVFLKNEGAKWDFMTLLNPSVGMDLPIGDSYIGVSYDLGINLFSVYPKENFIDHTFEALGEFNFSDFIFSVDNKFRRFSHRSGSEDTNRIKRQDNTLRVGVKAEFDQLAFDVGYSYITDDFLSDDNLFGRKTYNDEDKVLNIVDGEISYRFMPKTSALLETVIGFIDYSSPLSSDSYFLEVLGGLRGDLSRDLRIDLLGGFRYQDYDSTVISSSEEFTGFIARGNISYQVFDNGRLELAIERAIYESTYADNNYYALNYAGIAYQHYFGEKISGKVFGSYQYNTYPRTTVEDGTADKRYDHFVGTGCSIIYNIRKWFALELRYDYVRRMSRFSVYDYTDNVISIRGTIGV